MALVQVWQPGNTEAHVTQLFAEFTKLLAAQEQAAPLVVKPPAVLQLVQAVALVQVKQPEEQAILSPSEFKKKPLAQAQDPAAGVGL